MKQIDRALAIAEETGLGFCGPAICAQKALILGPGEMAGTWLRRGEALLQTTGLAHNHVYYRVAAIDWGMQAGDWALVSRMIDQLVDYTAAEPLPYVDLVVGRARALAALRRNPEDLQAVETLRRSQETAEAVDFRLTFPVSIS